MQTDTESELERSTIRKITRRTIPFLGLCYFLNYLDRTNIGFAKLSMSEDLALTETMFGLASGLFFIGYLLLEVPSNLALHRFGARRWIARIMVTWGLCATAMAFVNSAGALYTVRILLGAAEAGFFPGIMLYLTWWLPRRDRVRIIAVFLLSLPLSAAIGAPLSATIIQYVDGALGFEGWRWLFFLEGVPTIVLGVVCWFFLTDRPEDAKWLTEAERRWLAGRLGSENVAVDAKKEHSPLRALFAPRVLALGLVYFGVVYGVYSLSFYLPTVVAGFSEQFDTTFTILQTGLIVSVPFIIGGTAMLLWGRHSDKTGERRWHLVAPIVLGAVTIPTALYLNSPLAVMAMISLTAIGVFAALPVFWHFPPLVLSGAAAAAGIALINTLGNGAGFAAPYITGWLADATGGFKAGLWVVGGFMLLAAAVAWTISRQAVEIGEPEVLSADR